MKRGLLLITVMACSLLIAAAHEPGEDTTTLELGGGKVTIKYGTPKLGDRNLDEMIKPGLAWRMGMNNPTFLETSVALDFGGKKLVPGKYTLFAKADEKKNWTLIVSSGAQAALDPATVVLESPLHFMKAEKSQNVLSIKLSNGGGQAANLSVAWGTYLLHGSFKAAA